MTRILGIDPGLHYTGWAIIDVDGNQQRGIACGRITTQTKAELCNRLTTLSEQLLQVIQTYAPQSAAIEETFVNKNPLSSLKLGHARGALMLTVAQTGTPLAEYSATRIKKSITGTGRADKQQIGAMIKLLLPSLTVESEDAADAAAIAICHAHWSHSAL